MNIKVLSFDVDEYQKESLDRLSDQELYNISREDKNVLIWDSLKVFQERMNSGLVDTENRFIYFINL
jgi:hypothetical protein